MLPDVGLAPCCQCSRDLLRHRIYFQVQITTQGQFHLVEINSITFLHEKCRSSSSYSYTACPYPEVSLAVNSLSQSYPVLRLLMTYVWVITTLPQSPSEGLGALTAPLPTQYLGTCKLATLFRSLERNQKSGDYSIEPLRLWLERRDPQ
jgi:hypothetical protein